jgi:lipoyl(octanoyl) transferase
MKLHINTCDEICDYLSVWHAMQALTEQRHINRDEHADQLWLLEHQPVFTQGLAGKPEHVLAPGDIPVVPTDRGGQVTYHGPGQLMLYTLLDLTRLELGTRDFVRKLEKLIIDYLASLNITSEYRVEAPGVYVNGAKICSIGLRVRQGLAYHGLAFNIDMDLSPFKRINPCGYENLAVTSLANLTENKTINAVKTEIIPRFMAEFGYNQWQIESTLCRELGP